MVWNVLLCFLFNFSSFSLYWSSWCSLSSRRYLNFYLGLNFNRSCLNLSRRSRNFNLWLNFNRSCLNLGNTWCPTLNNLWLFCLLYLLQSKSVYIHSIKLFHKLFKFTVSFFLDIKIFYILLSKFKTCFTTCYFCYFIVGFCLGL